MEGTKNNKRKMDDMEHIMDLWYKQENDVLLVNNRQLMAENKRLKRRIALKDHILQINASRLREVENDLNWSRLMIQEIFARFPEVTLAMEQELETEEELMSE